MKRPLANAILAILLAATPFAQVIDTHTTVRHHREAVEGQPAEITQAEDAIQKNDFATAEALLKKALDTDRHKNELPQEDAQKSEPDAKSPWLYQAWFDLGFALNGLNRADESIAAYRKSVAAKPDVFESNLNLGLMLARTHNPEAEKYLRAATTLKPTAHVEEGQARAWLSLGHALEGHDPEKALQAYAKAAELTPADPEPHLSAALLDEREKHFADAEGEYKKVLALDPHSTEAAIGLTNIYMKSSQLTDAEPLLRRLVADRPNDEGLHLQLSRVLAAEEKKDDAIAELQSAITLSPNDSAAQRDLADLYLAAGKNDLAEAAYRTLVAAQPNNPELHNALGRALLLEKKFPEAQQELLATVRMKRDSPDAYVDLAFAASENKNYELTVRALNGRALLDKDKPNADMPAICFFLRASAYDHLRDFKNASADYRHFLEKAGGKYPDQEWQAKHRLIAIEPKKH
ncbi:MAG: tetratricopeptide repeat protein [Terriglobales bacterium]|jgi:tetratricopeptide (TPR) repeat protein